MDETAKVTKVDFAEELNRKIWKTSIARFNLARRLAAAHNLSLFTITFLSLYAIIATLIPVFLREIVVPRSASALSLFSVAMGVMIVALSALEAGHSYQLRGDRA